MLSATTLLVGVIIQAGHGVRPLSKAAGPVPATMQQDLPRMVVVADPVTIAKAEVNKHVLYLCTRRPDKFIVHSGSEYHHDGTFQPIHIEGGIELTAIGFVDSTDHDRCVYRLNFHRVHVPDGIDPASWQNMIDTLWSHTCGAPFNSPLENDAKLYEVVLAPQNTHVDAKLYEVVLAPQNTHVVYVCGYKMVAEAFHTSIVYNLIEYTFGSNTGGSGHENYAFLPWNEASEAYEVSPKCKAASFIHRVDFDRCTCYATAFFNNKYPKTQYDLFTKNCNTYVQLLLECVGADPKVLDEFTPTLRLAQKLFPKFVLNFAASVYKMNTLLCSDPPGLGNSYELIG